MTKGKKKRVLSPWSLIWQDQNYYLLAYDSEADKMKHFRVDKMRHVFETDMPREGESEYKKIDISSYVEETFSMYGGKQETVILDFPEELIGIAYDRFGSDVPQRKGDHGRVIIRTKCYVSNQFYGWLSGLGKDVKLAGPDSAVTAYKKYLKSLLDNM